MSENIVNSTFKKNKTVFNCDSEWLLISFCEKEMLVKCHNCTRQSTESKGTCINETLLWCCHSSRHGSTCFLFLNPLFIVAVQGKPLLASLLHLKWCGLPHVISIFVKVLVYLEDRTCGLYLSCFERGELPFLAVQHTSYCALLVSHADRIFNSLFW